MFFRRGKAAAAGSLFEKLQKAGPNSLSGTRQILAVAVLYENPRGIALPEKQELAGMLVVQYQRPEWIPANLSVEADTPVVARQLIRGVEISDGAGLDTAGSNRILSGMLAGVVNPTEARDAAAMAFFGNSIGLGDTFFAVVAR